LMSESGRRDAWVNRSYSTYDMCEFGDDGKLYTHSTVPY
jgi:hypothetical protein